jgi:hypothetical protein
LRTSVAEHETCYTAAVSPPELEQDVASDGNSTEHGSTRIGIIEHTNQVGRVFLHRGWTFASIGLAVPAKIGKNELVARSERLSGRNHKLVMPWKRMKQNYRRTIAENPVGNIGVPAAKPVHAGILKAGGQERICNRLGIR